MKKAGRSALIVDGRKPSDLIAVMRYLVFTMVGAMCLAGCVSRHPAESKTRTPSDEASAVPRPAPKPARALSQSTPGVNPIANPFSVTNQGKIVTLTQTQNGKIAAANASLRFVVVDFSLGPMPAADQRMAVYRQGLKVGEIKITGPERNGNIAADMVAGEARVGDEVRLEIFPERTPRGF